MRISQNIHNERHCGNFLQIFLLSKENYPSRPAAISIDDVIDSGLPARDK